jgi:hypothetical protein
VCNERERGGRREEKELKMWREGGRKREREEEREGREERKEKGE